MGRDSGLITNSYRFVFFVLARHLLYNRDFQAPPADWSAESFDTDCKLKTTDNNIHSQLRLRSKIVVPPFWLSQLFLPLSGSFPLTQRVLPQSVILA